MSEISSVDSKILGKFPHAPANSWTELLGESDRAAYVGIHRAIAKIAQTTASHGGSTVRAETTAGFHEKSGVRNNRPKDLWCAVVNESSDEFVGMPQVFLIVSGNGVEIGFAPAIH